MGPSGFSSPERVSGRGQQWIGDLRYRYLWPSNNPDRSNLAMPYGSHGLLRLVNGLWVVRRPEIKEQLYFRYGASLRVLRTPLSNIKVHFNSDHNLPSCTTRGIYKFSWCTFCFSQEALGLSRDFHGKRITFHAEWLLYIATLISLRRRFSLVVIRFSTDFFYLRLSSCVTRVAIVTIGFPKKKKGVFHFAKTPIIIPATKLTLLIISSSGFSPNKLGLGFFGSILRSLSWTSIWKWGPWRYSARLLLSNVPRRTTFTSSQKTSLPCSLPALSCKGCS